MMAQNPQQEEAVFELKRLTENQLQDILNLKRENDALQLRLSSMGPHMQ